jgi:hypothetical protein
MIRSLPLGVSAAMCSLPSAGIIIRCRERDRKRNLGERGERKALGPPNAARPDGTKGQ